MRGSSATQYLQELYARYAGPAVAVAPYADHTNYANRSYGYFQTSNSYFICTDPAKIDAIFDRLRHFPGENVSPTHTGAIYPQMIGGLRIRSTRDLTTGFGYDSSNPPTFTPSLPLSGGHMITFRAGGAITDGAAVTLTIRWVQLSIYPPRVLPPSLMDLGLSRVGTSLLLNFLTPSYSSTSGTEPKIKYYLEGKGQDPHVIGKVLNGVVGELRSSWMGEEANGLRGP
jgi:hypothetical protein